MLSRTFYRTAADTSAKHTRAAQAEADHAAVLLQRLITASDDGKENDDIDACILGLRTLKTRLRTQSDFLAEIRKADDELANMSTRQQPQLLEVERHTTETNAKLDSILQEKETLMRQLLIARQQLQEAQSSSSSSESENDFAHRASNASHRDLAHQDSLFNNHQLSATFIARTYDQFPSSPTLPAPAFGSASTSASPPASRDASIDLNKNARTSQGTASTGSDTWDLSPRGRSKTDALRATRLQSAIWDDSLDDDEDDDDVIPVAKERRR